MNTTPHLKRHFRGLAWAAAGLLASLATVAAAPKTWLGEADGSWLTGANWSPSALSASGDSVVYDANSTAYLAQTLDANWTVSSLTVGAVGGPVSIAGGGPFTLSSSGKLDLSQATADLTISADFAGPAAAPAVVVGANRTLTLSNMGLLNGARGPGLLRIVGAGKGVLDITNGLTVLVDGGSLSNNPPLRLGAGAGETVTVIVTNNSKVNVWGNGLRIGLGTAGTGMNILKMEGGTLSVAKSGVAGATSQNGIYVGSTAGCSAEFDLNGGVVELQNRLTAGSPETSLRVPSSAAAAAAVVNLNGGRLIVPLIDAASGASENGTLNFNGTTVVANRNHAAWLQGIPHAYVLAGGAIFDTAAFNVTIAQNLEAPLSGAGGGLTKLGSGALTLSGNNTYTGPTLVTEGTLAVSGSLQNSGALTLADGATLCLSNAANTSVASVAGLTLGSAGAVAVLLDYAGYSGNPSVPAINCSGAVSVQATTVTLTIAGLNPVVGSVPLIHYGGGTAPSLAGFKLKVPAGVVGNLAINASTHTIDLQVSRIVIHRTWYGNVSADWDQTTPNWDLGSGRYSEPDGVGDAVTFDDGLSPSPLNNNINLTGAWKPAMVNVLNNACDYAFSGGGKLTGATVLNKDGLAALTLNTRNDFTGGTTLSNGVLRLGNDAALGLGPVRVWGGAVSSDSATARALTNAVEVNADWTLGDSGQSGALTLAGPVDFNNAMRTVTITSPVTITAGITNGGLYKTGAETLLFLNCTNVWGNTSSEIRNGTVILSNSVLATGNSFRTACTEDFGLSRLVIGRGSLYLHTGANGNFRLGTSGSSGNTTATNLVDVAGEVSIPNPGNSDGRVLFGTSYNGVLNLLAGGLVTTRGVAREGGSAHTEFNFDGGTLRSSLNPANIFMQNLSAAFIRAGGACIDSTNKNITIAQALLDGGGNGGLTKLGTGTLTLSGANTYCGPTLVSAGKLVVTANHAASGPVTVAGGATLGFLSDVPGATVLMAGAAVSGKLSVAFIGQTDLPFAPAAYVTNLALTGTVAVDVTQLPAGFTSGTVPLIGYGSLNGAVTTGTLPNGVGGTIVNNTATRTIELVLTPPPLPPIDYSVTANQLTLSWSPDNLGCVLQSQTNALGLATTWFDVPGSEGTTSFTFTIDPAQPAVFFRLRR